MVKFAITGTCLTAFFIVWSHDVLLVALGTVDGLPYTFFDKVVDNNFMRKEESLFRLRYPGSSWFETKTRQTSRLSGHYYESVWVTGVQ